MKLPALVLASMIALPAAHAREKATAEWIPESSKVAPGQPFRTVVRMKVDEGWHTYWENPGEGGMPIAVKAELPDGWTLGEIQFPAPIRFMTGSLPGFGYEGEILFPLTITPPAGSEVTELPLGIAPKISWLTCNDETCVPGSAEPTLSPAQPELVEKAYAALPEPILDSQLTVSAEGETINVTLKLHDTWGDDTTPKIADQGLSNLEPYEQKIDPAACEVFPVTRNIIDPAAKPSFEKSDKIPNTWQFTASKSEYQDREIKNLKILLVGTDGKAWLATSEK